jgi:hypothetical protein
VKHCCRISMLLLLGSVELAQDTPKIKITPWPPDREASAFVPG